MEKGHYGEYSGNAKHSRVTASNYKATERDDAAHIDYLKRDVLYDDHHGHSDISMTADEKHISKLAGDMKYDKTHHGMSRESADLKYMPIEDDMKRGMSRESSELKYMPIEDDMKRGMSREESLQTKHLRSQVQNDYPRPMPVEAPRRFTETAYKRLSPDYPGKGMPTSEYVQDKYEEFRDGPKVERYTGDKSKTLIGFEARAGVSRKGSKPDYIDIDGDGNKKESMKEASDGMSRKSRSERLRGRAVKVSERSGEGQGGYDYENPRVMNMLNKAKMLDERTGMEGTGESMQEYNNQKRDEEMNRMMDERGGMNRMSKYGGNKHDYSRHMDAQGHMTKDGVVDGGKYGKGGHYKDYEGMSRDSYGMDRKSCATKFTGPGRYSSPAAFMGIKRPGRCTPFPNPDCEPGTPQYNLAKRLKPGGDLYKGKKK